VRRNLRLVLCSSILLLGSLVNNDDVPDMNFALFRFPVLSDTNFVDNDFLTFRPRRKFLFEKPKIPIEAACFDSKSFPYSAANMLYISTMRHKASIKTRISAPSVLGLLLFMRTSRVLLGMYMKSVVMAPNPLSTIERLQAGNSFMPSTAQLQP
jgi:hypothetical protein